jgi:4-phosphopantoate--beta-alanine ligase
MVSLMTNPDVPPDHPRAQSLHYRHKLVDGMHNKLVTPSGLCAHGRGEAYDYLLGEKTIPPADEAIKAAVASLLIAKHPIISVNGNVAALIPEEIVQLSKITNANLEINLFYHAPGRLEAIEKELRNAGAENILGLGDVPPETIPELSSNRRVVDPRGIFIADVVLVPLEDGDRTEALVRTGKYVITIDLNPLSRTAQKAQITIVDNLVRCVPKMIAIAKEFNDGLISGRVKTEHLNAIKNNFDQKKNLTQTMGYMIEYLQNKTKAQE